MDAVKHRLRAALEFLVARLQEASTWAGVSAALGLLHLEMSSAELQGLTALGTGLAALAAVIIKG